MPTLPSQTKPFWVRAIAVLRSAFAICLEQRWLLAMPNYHYHLSPADVSPFTAPQGLKTHEISYNTGISIPTIQRVIGLRRKPGSVKRKPGIADVLLDCSAQRLRFSQRFVKRLRFSKWLSTSTVHNNVITELLTPSR